MKKITFLFILSLVPCVSFAAGTNLSFDRFIINQGSQDFDPNYNTSSSQYQATYTDSVAGVDMRVTVLDLEGGITDNTNPDLDFPHALAFEDDSGKDGSSGDNAAMGIRTATNFPAHVHYKYEFFETGTSNTFRSDYLLTIYDVDYTPGERQEQVLLPTTFNQVFRFVDDGTVTTDEYTSTRGIENPDTNSGPNTILDKTFIENSGTETINSTQFNIFSGLADFVTNEGSLNASPMGAISVSLQDITEFEMILRMNTVPNNGEETGARFILDFSDPPDNPVIPEVSSLALALIAGAAGLLLLRRRS